MASGISGESISSPSTKFDDETDVLIVGSGGAGLTASLRAGSLGLRSIVIEKGNKIGGATAYSGGGLWVPGNPIAQADGVVEDRADVLKYMEAGISKFGDPGPASSLARRVSFLDNGPKMVAFLRDLGFKWYFTKDYPDYHELPGARQNGGRSIESEIFDMKKLADWEGLLLTRDRNVPPIHTDETTRLSRVFSSVPDFLYAARIMLPRVLLNLMGKRLTGMGQALMAQLLYLNKQRGREIWRDTPFVSLISEADGSISGVKVRQDGVEKAIRARCGVLLCAGGFARNKTMRDKYGRQPASVDWTSVPPGDNGDAIWEGMKVGAATSLLKEAWWGPTLLDPLQGFPLFALSERTRPFCIIVDSSGQRYMNEAASYTETGRIMYERHQEVSAVPSWLIVDQNYLNKYMVGTLMPRSRKGRKKAEESGRLISADTIEGLAKKIDVDGDQLRNTITRWNKMSAKGVDEDFGRGGDAYGRYFGDHRVKPNPNMGPIEKAPYYAMQIYPGDLGTKGGLLTDEYARVLRKDGSVIEGLYGAGNTTATIMGNTYLGAGSTLGPALTFSFIATNHMASRLK